MQHSHAHLPFPLAFQQLRRNDMSGSGLVNILVCDIVPRGARDDGNAVVWRGLVHAGMTVGRMHAGTGPSEHVPRGVLAQLHSRRSLRYLTHGFCPGRDRLLERIRNGFSNECDLKDHLLHRTPRHIDRIQSVTLLTELMKGR